MGLRGHIDYITHYTVSGWAFDEGQPESQVRIMVSVNGNPVGGAVADRYRDDLRVLGGGSSGKFAFHFSFEPPLSIFKEHIVKVTFKQTTKPLANGERRLPMVSRGGTIPEAPIPILVTSMGRSGSSLLMKRLASNDEIIVAGDFPYEIKMFLYFSMAFRTLISEGNIEQSTNPDTMADAAERFHIGFNPFNQPTLSSVLGSQAAHDGFFLGALPSILGNGIRDVLVRYYDLVRMNKGKVRARYIAEKTPTDCASRLVPRFVFGAAKEIVLIRDPRDVLCSFGSFWKASGDSAIESIANTMASIVDITREERDDVIVVKYEDLILREEETLESIKSFLEIDGSFEGSGTDDASQFRSHGTTSNPNASIGRWKTELTEEVLNKCLDNFGQYLSLFKYDM